MYEKVSEAFKTAIKGNIITTTARLTFRSFFSDASDLVIHKEISSEGIKLADYCFDSSEGKLIGTAASKELELEIINKEGYDFSDKEFDLHVGVLTDRNSGKYEYVPYGRFIVTSYEDLKSNNRYRIIAYDLMCKLNPKFTENTLFNPTYPITAKDYYRQLMGSYGIDIEDQTLINEGFIIKAPLEFEAYTGRYVLGRLAELFGSFAKINRDNKCQMYLKTETDETIELSQMNSRLEIDKRYGPVNVVTIGLSQVEGENVTLQDAQSIKDYGETTIRIDDNPFLYTEELREMAIQPLYERLKGFSYIPVSFKYKALLYSDCGDAIKVRNMEDGEYVNTIILNQDITLPRTRQSKIESLALTNTAQKYKYISNSKQALTQTEIKVDKQNKVIESVVGITTEQNEKINRITQTVDELNSQISDIADITTSQEKNTAKVELEGVNEGEPVRIVVRPIVEHISYLYPSNSLFPSSQLHIKTRIIRFKNLTTNEIVDYELPDNLYYYDAEYWDEFILDYDSKTCLINKKVGIDSEGKAYILEQPTTIDYEYPEIPITTGDYEVSIVGYDVGYLFVRVMATNIYTTQFATKVELKTEIKQLSDEINLQATKKVNEDEIIAKINLAVKNKQGIISIIGNQVSIDSDKFKLTNEGVLTATAGTIAGWVINSNYFGKGLAGIKGIESTSSDEDVFYAGKGLGYSGKPAFHVTNQGNTYVKSLNIRGRNATDVGKITVYNDQAQVGTTITYDNINSYSVTASNGGTTPTKGKCMHGYDMGHDYRCNWDGSRLFFIVDNANIGYVTTSSSDASLKEDVIDLPEELLNVIEEVEFKQFKLIDGNGKYKFGIIAQDLVNAFKKYDLNFKDYDIVSEVQLDLTDETLYFTIEYEQVLILKNQLLENRIKALERKVEKILEKI